LLKNEKDLVALNVFIGGFMANIKLVLAVVKGRDGINHPGLCMITETEKWFAFNDVMGFCFRKVTETNIEDIPIDEMKRKYAGVYRIMADKWAHITAILKGGDTNINI